MSTQVSTTGFTAEASRLWWLPLARGLGLLLLGLLLMIDPLTTLSVIVYVFAAFLVLDGLVLAVQGLAHRRRIGWGWSLVQAGADVLFALLLIVWPDISALTLYYVLVVWIVVLGVLSLIGAVQALRNRDAGWAWSLAFGLVSTLTGFLLVTSSQDVGDVEALIAVVFGIYALVSGSLHVVAAFAVRELVREFRRPPGDLARGVPADDAPVPAAEPTTVAATEVLATDAEAAAVQGVDAGEVVEPFDQDAPPTPPLR